MLPGAIMRHTRDRHDIAEYHSKRNSLELGADKLRSRFSKDHEVV